MTESLVLITGSNGGIGSALVEYLLDHGCRNVALHYRGSLEHVEALLKRHDLDPAKHLFYGDLSDEDQVKNLRQSIEQSLGPVSSLINIAGSSTNNLSWKLSVGEFQKVLGDNLLSTFLCCREFCGPMRANGGGRIINLSSIVASTGVAGASHYCAAKAGIEGFSKALALELAPKLITVNVLALGYFRYGLINHLSETHQEVVRSQIPLKRFGEGNEIGGYVRFLLSSEGAYTTGQVLHINGGQRL